MKTMFLCRCGHLFELHQMNKETPLFPKRCQAVFDAKLNITNCSCRRFVAATKSRRRTTADE